MELLNASEIENVSGGLEGISAECFDAVNLYAEWWNYGFITSEISTLTYTNICAPDTILIIDSTQFDIIACVSDINMITICLICG
jgi:hypothetical protein